MDYYTILNRFSNDYLLKLLRSNHGALFLSFAHREFKQNQIVNISYHTLNINLVLFMEENNYEIPEKQDIEDYSASLIDTWSKEDYQLLRRYYNKDGEIFIELTSYSERGIRWMEELGPKEFIGTESRFSTILKMLQELSSGSMEDPEKRIKELEKEKQKIDLQIKEIKESGKVLTLSDLQIKERYYQISAMARELLSDFKEVDHNFRKMVKDFYIKGIQDESRGNFLGATLDGYTELMNSPQGKSFEAFWGYLLADIGQDKISEMIEDIYNSVESIGLDTRDRLLFNLKKYLYNYGEKIIDSNHKLAEKLNRILSDPKRVDSKQLNSLIHSIKTIVLKGVEINNNEFITIDGVPDINLTLERPLQLPRKEVKYTNPDLNQEKLNPDMTDLFSMQFFERQKIEKIIRNALKSAERVTLSKLIANESVEYGVEEIITYFDLASEKIENSIILDETIEVKYKSGDKDMVIRVPEVIFCK
jgi:hypothetical protein